MAELAQTSRSPYDSQTGPGEEDSIEGFLYKVVKQFNRCESAESLNRQKALEDLRFKAGDQWPEQVKSQRTIEKRPCLTINKMKTFVHQITNDQRQNRPSINISPVGDKGDPETAKMLKGLIRQIERSCNADIAYDTGFDSAVSIGWGYWRLLTDYESDDSFDQVIKIKRIKNPFSVYLDPDSTEPDGSDAKWGFISEMMTREQFREEFPKAKEIAWEEGGLGDDYTNWSTPSHIRIAEYFYFENEKRTLLALSSGHIGYKDELAEDILASIEANPDLIVNEREVQIPKCRWCKLTSHEILEKQDWLGKWIPIVKVIGDEVDIEGETTLAGLIRDAKDSQRMYNFWCTSETELIALAPKAPWIMEEGQIEGHEQRWKEANTKSLPYLLYKGTSLAGKPSPMPQRQQFAGPPTGVVQAKISAAQDMQATTGIRFDATLQERTYDESGKALRELKRVGDLGNFHYVDNLSRSLKFTGIQLVDLIPKIYDTKRVVTIIREDGTDENVTIDPGLSKSSAQGQDPDGRMQRFYNPDVGDYAVVVTIGPSYATKRSEAADSMLMFMKNVPQAAPVIADLVAKNLDWPGADEIAARLQSALPPGMTDKSLDQLPPEAKGMVMNLQQQLQKLSQERDQAVSMLGDKDKDRQLEAQGLANERQKIMQDYDAKMANTLLTFRAEMEKIQQGAAQPVQQAELQMRKIVGELDVKWAKMLMDHHADMQQIELDRQLGEAKNKQENNEAKTKVSGLESKLGQMLEHLTKDYDVEVVRDPKSGRMTGAKRKYH